MKFGINFKSCNESGKEIVQGIAKCCFAFIGIYPKTSLLPVLSQIDNIIDNIAAFIKVKISDFQIRFDSE